MSAMCSRLREWRQRRGWTQRQLADRAGISRQTVGGIEAGRYGPGVEVGLRLCRALGCRVEDLFELAAPEEETVAAAPRCAGPGPVRVALGEIAGRIVARPLADLGAARWATTAAGGVAPRPAAGARLAVQRLPGPRNAAFLAGCDPALGLLAAHAGRGAGGLEALWWPVGNAEALAELGRREVHVAAVHRAEGAGPEPEPPLPAARFRLARWEMGWLLRAGNPRGIRGAADLLRPDVVLANREPGSGARALLDRLLAEAGVPPALVGGYARELAGHQEVAEAVRLGAADVGIGVAAVGRGLGFLPLTHEVCDLWVPRDVLDGPEAAAVLQALHAGAFRTDLAACGCYDTSETGEVVA